MQISVGFISQTTLILFNKLRHKGRVTTTAYVNYHGPVMPTIEMLILLREKNWSNRRKTLEAQERRTAGTLSHEIPQKA